MSHAQTIRQLTASVPPFPLPATQAEFDALTYTQRLVLHEKHPTIYKRFTQKDKV